MKATANAKAKVAPKGTAKGTTAKRGASTTKVAAKATAKSAGGVAFAGAGGAKPKKRAALVALVPSTYNAEGESDPFLRAYKTKWLSKLDFASDANVQSLFLLSLMVLAVGRENEAEQIADRLIEHVDVRVVNDDTKGAIASALRLSAWLKSKRGADVTLMLERAKLLARYSVHMDREWLSNEAAHEIDEARARNKLDYLAAPVGGVLRWLNEPAARFRAEQILAHAFEATRALMK